MTVPSWLRLSYVVQLIGDFLFSQAFFWETVNRRDLFRLIETVVKPVRSNPMLLRAAIG
jgi:hypothetical protein